MRSIGQSVQKLSPGNRDGHTDRHMCKTFTYPLSRAVINVKANKLSFYEAQSDGYEFTKSHI